MHPVRSNQNFDWFVNNFVMVAIFSTKHEEIILAGVSYQDVSLFLLEFLEEVFHTISLEPISENPTSKSFHEPSVELVRIDMIGTTNGELYH